jgi:signal transduction histidine kinase/DNA-binding CsgD family transcriptional regulator
MARANESLESGPGVPEFLALRDGHLPASALTRRQREIAGLVARGLTNAEIASDLALTGGTVANHVASILQRLGFDSRTEVAAWAVEYGLHGGQDRLLTTLEQLLECLPLTLKGAMDEAATLVAQALDSEKVDAFLYEEATDTLVAVGTNKTPLGVKQHAVGLDRQAIADGGRAVEIFLTGKPHFDNEVQDDAQELSGVKRWLDIRSQIGVPLEVSGVRRGALTAQTTKPDFFSPRDLLFLQAVSRWVSNMAQRAELVEGNAVAAHEQGRRLAAEELVMVLAHDLRNYLAPIRARVDLLGRRAAREDDPGYLRDTTELRRSVLRLERLTSDLLDIARIDQGLFEIKRAQLDLAELVREAAQALALPGTPIAVDAPRELPIMADPVRMRQALENLLANAVQHAPADTSVSVQVAREDQGPQPQAVILVSDQGPGIDPAILPRVFERFSRSGTSSGLGIGLFMARQIAEAHGGTLHVNSSPDGTKFRLLVPC